MPATIIPERSIASINGEFVRNGLPFFSMYLA
jgi:hypothetical protein